MQSISYMTGILTFYLKGEIKVEQNFLRLTKPNTILALIPLGSEKNSIPVTQICAVDSSFRVKIGRIVFGFLLMCLIFNGTIRGLIWSVIGLAIFTAGFETVVNIQTTAGRDYKIPIIIFEKQKVAEVENMVNGIIDRRLNDTNDRIVTETQTDKLVDAINNVNSSRE
jgi:hypothetical protein